MLQNWGNCLLWNWWGWCSLHCTSDESQGLVLTVVDLELQALAPYSRCALTTSSYTVWRHVDPASLCMWANFLIFALVSTSWRLGFHVFLIFLLSKVTPRQVGWSSSLSGQSPSTCLLLCQRCCSSIFLLTPHDQVIYEDGEEREISPPREPHVVAGVDILSKIEPFRN